MTVLLAIAVAVGVLGGLACGGRLSHVLRARLGWGWLLLAGAGLQAAILAGAVPVHGRVQTASVLLSYALLAGFAALNLGRPGMGVLLIGVVLNTVPIAVNGGMPVERGAIVSAGIASPADVGLLTFGSKRHLASGADRVRVLDDRFPDWPSRVVLSVGDLVIAVGTAAVVAGMLGPGVAVGRRRRRTPGRRIPDRPIPERTTPGPGSPHPDGATPGPPVAPTTATAPDPPVTPPAAPSRVGATGRRATG